MWKVEYDNDVGCNDDGFYEWWNVTDGKYEFRAYTEEQAEWLADVLNRGKYVNKEY